jgi:hypothetical protein
VLITPLQSDPESEHHSTHYSPVRAQKQNFGKKLDGLQSTLLMFWPIALKKLDRKKTR